jgi:predicted amidohydrolase
VFSPNGKVGVQGKIHMTRFENEEWFVSPHSQLKVFETDFGLMGVNICYDVEFPELARALALHGVSILVVPSCTDDRQGFLRVRYCAQARAIENQLYVIHSGTVGSLPMVPAISLNYGQASILTPSDYSFSRDGILAEGIPNQETMVTGDLDLKKLLEAREQGTVLPLRDSVRTKDVIRNIEKVLL